MATSAGSISITAVLDAGRLNKDLASVLGRLEKSHGIRVDTRGASRSLGQITGLASEFQKSLEASNARVIAFGASAGIIYGVQRAFQALIDVTVEVDSSLANININLGASSSQLKSFGDSIFDIAKNTGSSFKDVAAAATEFSRQGLGMEETLKRTSDALILTRLSGLDVVSSTEALTAAVNTFASEALNTADIVNKLAAVDARFAVSSKDLAEAMKRVGASASDAGIGLDELFGLVTAVQQSTARGGPVIGNALKTIFTRVGSSSVLRDLEDLGIAVKDSGGAALSTMDVIKNLANSYDDLTPSIKAQTAQLVGGVYHINILKAMLRDLSKENSIAAEATRASAGASGEATLKNEKLNETLKALFNTTSNNFAKLGNNIGETSVGPGAKTILGLVNNLLDAVNTKDSESVGAKIGSGLLTGITSFVTGPGVVIASFVIGKLLKNFSGYALGAGKELLGLNSVSQQQLIIQTNIAGILQRNPQYIAQMMSGETGRLAVLRQITQEMLNQSALQATTMGLSQSISRHLVGTALKVDPTAGVVPKYRSFSSPLLEAINREKEAGYSSSEIRVGKSSELSTPSNPLGIGVYNTSEGSLENGMALSRLIGVNPKTKGMTGGHVPNFATDSVDATMSLVLITLVAASFVNLKKTMDESSASLKNFTKEKKEENKEIQKAIKAKGKENNDLQDAAEERIAEVTQKSPAGRAREKAIRASELAEFRASEKAEKQRINLLPLAKERSKAQIRAKIPGGEKVLQKFNAGAQQRRDDAASIRKENASARRVESVGIIREANAGIAERQKLLFAQMAEGAERMNVNKAESLRANSFGAKASSFIKNQGMSVGMMGAMAASTIGGFIPEENKTGKAVASGVGDVFQYAAMGALLGPLGAAGGALLGMGIAATKLADAKGDQAIFDMGKAIDAMKDKSNKFSSGAQGYVKGIEDLNNGLNDPKTKPEALLKFQNQIAESLNKIPQEFQQEILSAGSTVEKLSEAISNRNKKLEEDKKTAESVLAMRKAIQDDSNFFTSFFKEGFGAATKKILSDGLAGSINSSQIISGNTSFLDATTKINDGKYEEAGLSQNVISVLKQLKGEISGDPKKEQDFNDMVDVIKTSIQKIFRNEEAVKSLIKRSKENADTAKALAKTLQDLNDVYKNLQITLASSITSEKNRVSVLRELSNIRTEGTIGKQLAATKGATNLATPFLDERGVLAAAQQSETQDLQNKFNTNKRASIDKFLSDNTDVISKRSEEMINKLYGSINDPNATKEAIDREFSKTKQVIDKMSGIITKSLRNQDPEAGKRPGEIQEELKELIEQLELPSDQKATLIQSLGENFNTFALGLAKIEEQNKVDLEIQKITQDYQKRMLSLTERLAFAGGAKALSNTGAGGVSENYDNLTGMIGSTRKNLSIGSEIEKASGTFKLLELLQNQFNITGTDKGLGALQDQSKLGRTRQIEEELDLAKKLTNISLIARTGKGIEKDGSLDQEFNKKRSAAANIAEDQINSELKLKRSGDYLELLALESQLLTMLTTEQSKFIINQTPTKNSMQEVLQAKVGDKIEQGTKAVTEKLQEIYTTGKIGELEKEARNLVPVMKNQTVSQVQDLHGFARINEGKPTMQFSWMSSLGRGLRDEPTEPTNPIDLERFSSLMKEIEKLKASQPVSPGQRVSEAERKKLEGERVGEASQPVSPGQLVGEAGRKKLEASQSASPGQLVGEAGRKKLEASQSASPGQRVGQAERKKLEASAKINELRDKLFTNKEGLKINEEIEKVQKKALAASKEGNTALAAQLLQDLFMLERRKEMARALENANYNYSNLKGPKGKGQSEYSGTLFESERASIEDEKIKEDARNGRVAFGAITDKNLNYNTPDFAKATGDMISTFQQDFKSGIGSAFSEAIKGTKTLREAFADMFLSIADTMLNKSLDMLVNVGMSAGKSALGFKNGGMVGYASGGLVTGGSGKKDDVPVLMQGGEYVIKQSSANYYGADYLNKLNRGSMPKYAEGGISIGPLQNEFTYNNPDRPTSGKFEVDSSLSSYALMDENNPQNKARANKNDKLDQYLIAKADYEKQKIDALAAYKAKVKGIFIQGLIGAGVTVGAGAMAQGMQKPGVKGAFDMPMRNNDIFAPKEAFVASGGYMPRGTPAMVMGNEFIMSPEATRRYGPAFMDKLNSRSLPKYAQGGLAGSSYPSTSSAMGAASSNSGFDELIGALNDLSDAFSSKDDVFEKGGAGSGGGASGLSISNNISINVSSDGVTATSETTGSGKEDKKGGLEKSIGDSQKLSELLKAKITEVIVEQKRPGGLLYTSSGSSKR